MLKGDPLAKSITVFDLKGVSLTDLAGEKMNYTKVIVVVISPIHVIIKLLAHTTYRQP